MGGARCSEDGQACHRGQDGEWVQGRPGGLWVGVSPPWHMVPCSPHAPSRPPMSPLSSQSLRCSLRRGRGQSAFCSACGSRHLALPPPAPLGPVPGPSSQRRRPILSQPSRKKGRCLADVRSGTEACLLGVRAWSTCRRAQPLPAPTSPPAEAEWPSPGHEPSVPSCRGAHAYEEESKLALPHEVTRQASRQARMCPCASWRHRCPQEP